MLGWFLAHYALRRLAARGRGLEKRLRRRDRESGIIGQARLLALLDDAELAGGELLLALLVAHEDAAIAHADVYGRLQARACGRDAIVRAERRAADADGRGR